MVDQVTAPSLLHIKTGEYSELYANAVGSKDIFSLLINPLSDEGFAGFILSLTDTVAEVLTSNVKLQSMNSKKFSATTEILSKLIMNQSIKAETQIIFFEDKHECVTFATLMILASLYAHNKIGNLFAESCRTGLIDIKCFIGGADVTARQMEHVNQIISDPSLL